MTNFLANPLKPLLFLAALVVSAVPIKAADDIEFQKKQAYFFGFVFRSGTTLYAEITDEEITKEYSQYFLSELVKELSKHSDAEDVMPKVKEAQNAVMKTDTCNGVFE